MPKTQRFSTKNVYPGVDYSIPFHISFLFLKVAVPVHLRNPAFNTSQILRITLETDSQHGLSSIMLFEILLEHSAFSTDKWAASPNRVLCTCKAAIKSSELKPHAARIKGQWNKCTRGPGHPHIFRPRTGVKVD